MTELHTVACRRVYGVDVEVKAVAARRDHVVAFARKHAIAVRGAPLVVIPGRAEHEP